MEFMCGVLLHINLFCRPFHIYTKNFRAFMMKCTIPQNSEMRKIHPIPSKLNKMLSEEYAVPRRYYARVSYKYT